MKTKRHATRARPSLALTAKGAAALAACLAFGGLWLSLEPPRAGRAAGASIGGPFTLVADDGRTVTDQSFPGKYLIVYFGYTACRDVCPNTLNTLSAAMGRLGTKAVLVQPLFITLDPLRDSPPILHRYVKAFSPTLIGLTGSAAALHDAARQYQVASVVHQDGTGPAYAIDHGSVLFLVSPDRRFVRPVPADANEMVMAQAIARGL